MKKTKAKNKTNFVLLFLALILIFSAISVGCDFFGKKSGEEILVNIQTGESLESIISKAEDEGAIKYGSLFRLYLIKNGYDTTLQSGGHILYKNMGYKKAAKALSAYGLKEGSFMFTIPEGYEIYRLAQKAYEDLGISEEEFYEAAKKSYPYEFILDIPKRENALEGYLFPDTYELFENSSANDLIKRMLERFSEIWTEERKERAKEINMTMDDVIILASIIEREAGTKEEMALVSSVFHNRLKKGMPLQSCATVQYILKERKEVLSLSDTKIDSPYNTYMYPGLPIGPIASPGLNAIDAALYPEKTDYYYFKVNKNGETLFSKTLNEHNSK